MSRLSFLTPDGKPAIHAIAADSVEPLEFDMTPFLAVGETASLPQTELTNLRNGSVYAAGLSGVPTVAADIVTQTVSGLRKGERYRLEVSVLCAAGKRRGAELTIECLF